MSENRPGPLTIVEVTEREKERRERMEEKENEESREKEVEELIFRENEKSVATSRTPTKHTRLKDRGRHQRSRDMSYTSFEIFCYISIINIIHRLSLLFIL